MDIETREDIDRLIRLFYTRVREDFFLKTPFNIAIPNDELWEHHFVKLIDFWESGLLQGKAIYEGKPIGLHLWVDNISGRIIEKVHFDRWLGLWDKTVDELFEGPVAEKAKSKAYKLGKVFFDKIMEARP